jgi:hypothetical protein
MASNIKFRVQAGALAFELEGPRSFVQGQIDKHRGQIDAILEEQARLVKSGKALQPPTAPARRGRPPKQASAVGKAPRGRRPGRQPVIIRKSSLSLKATQVVKLRNRIAELAGDGKLGKDATVFAIAHYLCDQVFGGDRFSAGDVIVAYKQAGSMPKAPVAASVDVVQMLRNLAASSIGKQWVIRNADGTFSLTAKGKEVGRSGKVVRPRGRRPSKKSASVSAKLANAPKRRRGRPPKNAAKAIESAPAKRPVGRPRKNPVV